MTLTGDKGEGGEIFDVLMDNVGECSQLGSEKERQSLNSGEQSHFLLIFGWRFLVLELRQHSSTRKRSWGPKYWCHLNPREKPIYGGKGLKFRSLG